MYKSSFQIGLGEDFREPIELGPWCWWHKQSSQVLPATITKFTGARTMLGFAQPQTCASDDQQITADRQRTGVGRVGLVRAALGGRRRLQEWNSSLKLLKRTFYAESSELWCYESQVPCRMITRMLDERRRIATEFKVQKRWRAWRRRQRGYHTTWKELARRNTVSFFHLCSHMLASLIRFVCHTHLWILRF